MCFFIHKIFNLFIYKKSLFVIISKLSTTNIQLSLEVDGMHIFIVFVQPIRKAALQFK